jgi:hypothetical protein
VAPASRASLRALAPLGAIALVAAATSAGLWRPLCVYGHSVDLDPFRAVAFDAAFRAGDWLPSWTPWWYHGHGSPLFHYYAPLPFYLTELFLLAGASLARALQATLFSAWLASGLALYLLARDALSRPAACAAAVLYLLAPYHLVDMLVRHALGEHLSFAWLPLAVWGVAGGVRHGGRLRFALGALAVGALPLTHNVTALVALPLVIAWSVFEAARARSAAGLARAAAAVLLGLALSAFFWLPALAELGQVPARERLTSGYYAFETHFVAPRQLWQPGWGFGGSVAGEGDGLSFQIGLVHLALLALALAAIARGLRREGGRRLDTSAASTLAAFAVFAAAAWMTTAASRLVWAALPPLALLQFPWRFLAFAAFGASLAAGFAIDGLIPARRGAFRGLAAAAAIASAVLAYAPYTQPRFAVYDRAHEEIVAAPYAEAQTLLHGAARYQDACGRATLAALVASGQGGASRHEYVPAAVNRLPTRVPAQRADLLAGGRIERAETLAPNHERFTLAPGAGGELRFHQFYFPGWRATIDGETAPLTVEPASGLIRVALPAGARVVELEFGSTPLRRAAAAGSLVAVAALLLVAGAPLARARPPRPQAPPQPGR